MGQNRRARMAQLGRMLAQSEARSLEQREPMVRRVLTQQEMGAIMRRTLEHLVSARCAEYSQASALAWHDFDAGRLPVDLSQPDLELRGLLASAVAVG
jgi:hypothetical protein